MIFTIPCDGIQLQAHLREPEGYTRGSVVLCHPHPVYGGTMDNKVIFRVSKTIAQAGFAALRFNFRGAGKSSGMYDHGLGEKDDVAAAIDWVWKRYPGKPIAVLGYSFGAWVGLQVGCRDSRVNAVVGIGLPLDLYDFEYLVDYSNPSLYIVGTEDEFCSRENLDDLARRLSSVSRIERLQNADHFFSDRIEEVQKIIESFFSDLLQNRALL
jgi:alpha/beta superfamily hydrolase